MDKPMRSDDVLLQSRLLSPALPEAEMPEVPVPVGGDQFQPRPDA